MKALCFVALSLFSTPLLAQYPRVITPASVHTPVIFTAYSRTRENAVQAFSANPDTGRYGYLESTVRLGFMQQIHHWDWRAELIQPSVLFLPKDAVSPVAAQGQLGYGGIYFASNGENTNIANVALKQAYLRYRTDQGHASARLGRFEFFGGMETHPLNRTIEWLQTYRISQRLIGNFSFSVAQRGFDGADVTFSGDTWNVTSMVARANQGNFNVNANPELNVDVQTLSYIHSLAAGHVQLRGFAIGYHDGRTGLTKVDNRSAAARAADHDNIRLGTYGGDALAAFPVGEGRLKGNLDFLFWGALQNGNWGKQQQSAGSWVGEGGYQFTSIPSQPWFRGGAMHASGDDNPNGNTHNTFVPLLPSTRAYSRIPFYASMNMNDQYVQLMDSPKHNLNLRSELHFLQLADKNDLWYAGGGAADTKIFGYSSHPSNNRNSFATIPDISAAYDFHKNYAITTYYGLALGRSVINKTFPAHPNEQYGYIELVYSFNKALTRNTSH